MKTQHTPAPWHTWTERRSNGDILHIAGPKWAGFAYGHQASPPVCQVAYASDADLRLIAAAPELLDALNNLQANPNDPRAHRQALDAIAQATK